MPRQPTKSAQPQFPGLEAVKVEYQRPEDEEEKSLRLYKEKHAFHKELITYAAGLLLVVLAVFYCFWMLIDKSSPPEDRRSAWTAVSTIIGGIVGYVFGKQSK